MTDRDETQHRALRELLGSYALEHLPAADRDMVGAHLDGCAECRSELDEIAGLAALLSQVDPARFNSPPVPPPGLGEQIRADLADETRARDADEMARRRAATQERRRILTRVSGVAAALVLIAGIGGVAVGRGTAPQPAAIPMEAISLTSAADSGVSVAGAVLIAHSWGVELRIEASGFEQGATYRAAFRSEAGGLTPAGEFLGTGSQDMNCNLQSAILREDVTSVVVTDADGSVVLRSSL